MTAPTVPGIEALIASNLRLRREAAGLSLGQLAARSGVSKAMIARVESGASSPTAALLGRLCAGLGITLSSLMAAAETADVGFYAAATQPTWRDPATRLERRLVAPASGRSAIEIARLVLPPTAFVDYSAVPVRPLRQHIIGLSGCLLFTIGGETTAVGPGDCLFAVIDRPTRLEAAPPGAAEYLVVQEGA